MRRAPLLAAACWFALGIAIARHWLPSAVLILAIVFLAIFTWLALRWAFRIAIVPVAAIWITAGFWCWQIRPVPQVQRALQPYADGLSRNVRGRVVRVRPLAPRTKSTDQDNDPAWWIEREPQAADALSVDIAVEAIEDVTPDVSRMVPMSGGVRVTILSQDHPLPTLRCGDTIEIPLRLKVPERYRDPGAWQYADYLLSQGISMHANVRANRVQAVSGGTGNLQCRLYSAQTWASERMLRFVNSTENRRLPSAMQLTEDDAGMLNAMIFGDRTRLNHSLRLGFERTGSFHLFVVSGMHVALLAGMVFWIFEKLRLHRWLSTILTLALMTIYALLTGFGAPVQRALFMTAVFLIARLLSRKGNVLNALGAAALAELVWSPGSLFEASFQMTFLAIVAIAGIAVPLGERTFLPYTRVAQRLGDLWWDPVLPPRLAQLRVMLRMWGEALAGILGHWAGSLPGIILRCLLFFAELVLIGLIAEMIMALPMAMYFHRATIFALPANILTIPIVSLLAPAAIITFCATLLSPWLALLPAAGTALLLHGIVWSIERVSRLQSADLRVPGPVWWIAAVALMIWLLCCWAVRRSRAWTWAAGIALPLVFAAILWPEKPLIHPGALEITAIDVGQGDSLLVVSPQGDAMLVDAGGPVGGLTEAAAATSTFDVGEEVVSPYLWSRRIRRLDVLVLSHAHSDHMGGMTAVMRSFHPRELWVAVDPDSEAYRALLKEAAELHVTVRHLRAGNNVEWSGTTIKVLSPQSNYTNSGDPANNDSLVMRVEYGKASVLLEGDAEAASEQAMLARGLAPITLLKVGHHGSRTSTTPEFFSALAPKDAIVSVGKNNTFGHPRMEVIERIAAGGTRLYRTDEFGLTTFLLEQSGAIRELAEPDQDVFK
ncbi:DNA internalization-related competence protein ComEC/Rec2 [Edaphobacter albus]|uniref:DNA internalization-related competence protein ComEC/Rec2 n=1 Tax=Edaphobacter sp. 4G125 TaxID=2763071 RepID=UPI00210296B0|nr:DNA internalization-related competence protein ComEC/Rec2 [Edaphobacter sp. 4G125]